MPNRVLRRGKKNRIYMLKSFYKFYATVQRLLGLATYVAKAKNHLPKPYGIRHGKEIVYALFKYCESKGTTD